ncbi:MAG: phage protein GemA/Gp16 family protein [Candidatus Binataceae bacterium]
MTAGANRRAEIAKIHVAKKQLGLDDETYRAIVARVSGQYRAKPVASSAALDDRERDALLREFERLGWRATQPGGRRDDWIDSREPHVRLLIALWGDAYDAGIIRAKARRPALRKFVKRMTGRDALQWLSPEETNTCIEALKAMLKRAESAPQGGETEEQPGL